MIKNMFTEHGMRCPNCGQAEAFHIEIAQVLTINVDGFVENAGNDEYDDRTPCMCESNSCGTWQTVGYFRVKAEESEAPSVTYTVDYQTKKHTLVPETPKQAEGSERYDEEFGPRLLAALRSSESPKQAHTPEPWNTKQRPGHAAGLRQVITAKGVNRIAVVSESNGKEQADANAARIVACVNAFVGILDPVAHMAGQHAKIKRLIEAFNTLLINIPAGEYSLELAAAVNEAEFIIEQTKK